MDDVNLAVVRVETTGSVLEAQYLTEPHAFTRAEVDRRVVPVGHNGEQSDHVVRRGTRCRVHDGSFVVPCAYQEAI